MKDIDKAEFTRGYNFGKRDGVNEVMNKIIKSGGKYREKFEADEIIVAIPKEYFLQIEQEAKKTL